MAGAEEEWYYVDASTDDNVGPVSVSELRDAWTRRALTRETLCWNSDLEEWTALVDLPTLKAKVCGSPARAAGAGARPPPRRPGPPQTQGTATSAAAAASSGGGPAAASSFVPPEGGVSTVAAQIAALNRGRSASRACMGTTQNFGYGSAPSVPSSRPARATSRNAANRPQQPGGATAASATGGAGWSPPPPSGPKPSAGTAAAPAKAIVQHARQPPAKDVGGYSQSGRGGDRWVEKLTADRCPYYLNQATDEVSWDKPQALMTAEEMETSSGEWVWITDAEEAWLPARVMKRTNKGVQVQLQNGSRRTVEQHPETEPLWPLTLSCLSRLEEDLVMVQSINQGLMLWNLKERYRRDQIYTWVGADHSVLVAVNPFKQLPIYSFSVIDQFSKPSVNRLDPPHVFAIANNALSQLRLNGKCQAVLISGESGAGKTEATKQVLAYLAEVAGSTNNIEQQILQANPVLESFGNAKTLRNDNSSRFGRWMEVHIEPSRGGICGARIESYLLEKSRVVFQAKGERSYHIFYQLCCSSRANDLQLSSPDTFRFLAHSGCVRVRSIDDARDYENTVIAFEELNFSPDEISWIFSLVAGILHLGNIAFDSDGGEGSNVSRSGQAALQNAASVMQLAHNDLAQAVTHRTLEVRGVKTEMLNNPNQAMEALEALAKAAYNNLFLWLVRRINTSVEGESADFIGVLDIFGFEIFEKNSFEQLCINFCNEKLQQHFNAHTFKQEEETYISEGIQFESVPYIDNQDVLDLIEKRPIGILNLLDEEVRMPEGNDEKWLHKVQQSHHGHPRFGRGDPSGAPGSDGRRRRSQIQSTGFEIVHYAGSVNYDSMGMVEKNSDNISRNAYDLMSASQSPLLRDIFPPKDKNPRRVETLAGQFRKQLTNLMTLVSDMEPHYIRCVKPNDDKAANSFGTRMCIEQLTYAGVFEAVQIRKQGYPFRLTHRRFAGRYRPLAYNSESGWATLQAPFGDVRSMCQAILNSVSQDFSNVQIGNTMVLYRADDHRILELLRNLTLERVLPAAQRQTRLYIGRQCRRAIARTNVMCDAAMGSRDTTHMEQVIKACSEIMSPYISLFNIVPHKLEELKLVRFRMEERVQLNAIFAELSRETSAEHRFGEFADAVRRADEIQDMPGTDMEMRVEQQCRDMLATIASVKMDPWAQEALYLLDRFQMQAVADEAKRYGYRSDDIVEIERLLALSEEELVKLQVKRANEMGDQERVVNREIRLKEVYLDTHGPMFVLNKCPQLRDPINWANAKFLEWNRDDLAQGFMQHTRTPIHESLTVLSSSLAREAVRQFRNLLGYMGDRKSSYPDTLAAEYCGVGVREPELRTELYVQVLKQLNGNTIGDSEHRGWNLLAAMLRCFPPPQNFEFYLFQFLNTVAPEDLRGDLVTAMHVITYGGAVSNPPNATDIGRLARSVFTTQPREEFRRSDVVALRPHDHGDGDNGKVEEGGTGEGVYTGGATHTGASQDQSARSGGGGGGGVGGGGRTGPPPAPNRNDERPAMIMFDFIPPPDAEDGMMRVRKGDMVDVLDASDPEWWLVRLGPNEGWIPASYVSD